MLNDFSKTHLPHVEKEMLHFIQENTNHEKLAESMSYSVSAGGKRLRPLIILATVAAFNKKNDLASYQVAASLEMIHTYSLIHDDLPAMDDDDLRRGKPTNHKVYGEALAVLAGDGLLTAAFQILTEVSLDPDKKILLLQLLAKASGPSGMVAGQAGDMAAEEKKVNLTELKAIHAGKTGALLTYAFMAGGILANQVPTIIASLQKLGEHVGLAFQIRDDLLDVLSTTEALGKKVHQDAQADKSTYPALLGIEGAQAALSQELTEAKKNIAELTEDPQFDGTLLLEIIELLARSEAQ